MSNGKSVSKLAEEVWRLIENVLLRRCYEMERVVREVAYFKSRVHQLEKENQELRESQIRLKIQLEQQFNEAPQNKNSDKDDEQHDEGKDGNNLVA